MGEGEEGGRVVEEEGEGEEEEEEEGGEGLEGREAVDGGASLDEGIGCGGEECFVDDGDGEGEDDEVERQVFEATWRSRRRRRRKWMVRFRSERGRRFEMGSTREEKIVKPQ